MKGTLLHMLYAVACALSFSLPAHAVTDGGGTAGYVALEPALVVNISHGARSRFLQVEAQLKVSDPEHAAAIQRHSGAIRHQLILLFSDQSAESLLTSAGKEQLRAEALAAIQRVLEQTTGRQVVDALYFTHFVVQ